MNELIDYVRQQRMITGGEGHMLYVNENAFHNGGNWQAY